MSGVVKGIKKVFKKVVKFVKKALPVVLAVAAIVFTGGAALGLTGTWAGMAGTIGSALGGSGVVGSALTGAIYQAGAGAAIGGIISEASGGSFSKGAKAGAITGAITGGVSGAYGHMRNAAATKAAEAGLPTEGMNPASTPKGVETYAMGENVSNIAPGSPGHVPAGANNILGNMGEKVGGLFQQGGWIERNQDLVGNVAKGIGSGLVAAGEADAEKDLLRERQRITSENYAGTDPGANYQALASGTGGLMPSQRFSPQYYGSYEYRYNPETARIERVPAGG